MPAAADAVFALPDRPALPFAETPAWNMTLTVLLPDGYAIHPASLELIRDQLRERAPLVSTPEGRHLDILCSAVGMDHDAAKRDALAVTVRVLRTFGLPPESVVEQTVTPFQTAEELLAQLDPPKPMGTVTRLPR